MNKPVILHICLSKGWGGLEMYPIRIGKEFQERGYKIYGLCISNSQVAKGMRDAGIEVFEIKNKSSLIFSDLFKLNSWLKERSVNTVHCHKSGDVLVSALLSLVTTRCSFFTEHMGITSSKKDLYHTWIYKHLDKVLAISNETYQRNLIALPVKKEKLTRLWLGTDIPKARNNTLESIIEIKKKLGLKSNSITIGNVGRICPGKGQKELLEGFALIAGNYPKTQLLIVGGLKISQGADTNYLKTLQDMIVELGLEDRVIFAGFKKDTYEALSIMDIVCLPNHNEAFGLTAIEAMAARKAIVASTTGALPEVLDNTALFCNPLNPNEIASRIESYINDHDLKNDNAGMAYLRAKKEFSMEAHISKLEKLYYK
ncbi:glycosyltransferase family 4 protein [Vibrio coralliilyticus]|uniref:glycosyltransferase family 4 protein n=1 Tax=Vibrio coralliilyticus TaxID=190893 RepID=UPI001F1D4843|nr:glycosyltransferase family 4 protein [Vibrio coralliilyticus]